MNVGKMRESYSPVRTIQTGAQVDIPSLVISGIVGLLAATATEFGLDALYPPKTEGYNPNALPVGIGAGFLTKSYLNGRAFTGSSGLALNTTLGSGIEFGSTAATVAGGVGGFYAGGLLERLVSSFSGSQVVNGASSYEVYAGLLFAALFREYALGYVTRKGNVAK